MSAVLLGVGWAGFGVALLIRLRSHFPLSAPLDGARAGRAGRGRRRGRPKILERCGRFVLRAARRPQPDAARARTVGLAALLTVPALFVSPVLVPVPFLGALLVPWASSRRHERRRLIQMEADLPETIDLLTLAVAAGCNVSLAVAAAGRRGIGPLAAELRRVTDEVAWGRRMADALEAVPARAGEITRPLVAALAASERYGSPLRPALERLADDVRRQRRRRAEEAARRVPVALLFPLVLCILPAFALLTVAPLIAGALGELGL